MKKTKKQRLAVLASTPLIAGVLIASTASAATTTTGTQGFNQIKSHHQMSRKGHQMPEDTSALASIFGMSEGDIKTALSSGTSLDALIAQKGLNKETVLSQLRAEHEAQMDARIKADVTSGKLTQAQADEMKTRHAQEETDRKQELATALGISVETLTAEMNAGKTLDQLATAHGLTPEALKTKLDTAREASMKSKLAQDVASGKLTQAQADSIMSHKNSHGQKRHTGKKMRMMHFSNAQIPNQ